MMQFHVQNVRYVGRKTKLGKGSFQEEDKTCAKHYYYEKKV